MNIRLLLIFAIIIGMFSSCMQKRLTYLQSMADSLETGHVYMKNKPDYKLRPYDALDIDFSSTNEEIMEIIQKSSPNKGSRMGNNSMNNQMRNGGGAMGFFSGYLVNDTGYVDIPPIGFVKVGGYTMSEARKIIQLKTDEIFKDTKVFARLLTFKVVFLGEVGSPGVRYFYQEELNILEAFSQIGISTVGNRKNILVVRPTPNGYTTFNVDVTKRRLLEQEEFFLAPNDMVYVEPVKLKGLRMAYSDFTFYTSIITTLLTTTLLVLNIQNLNK